MKMAMKDGQILIREADNVQFTIIKSWGKMKWSRQTQTLSGPAKHPATEQTGRTGKLATVHRSRAKEAE